MKYLKGIIYNIQQGNSFIWIKIIITGIL